MILVHLIRELLSVRATLAAAQRLAVYGRAHSGAEGESETIEWIKVSAKANDEAICRVEEWLSAQVIALHSPAQVAAMTSTPPRTNDN